MTRINRFPDVNNVVGVVNDAEAIETDEGSKRKHTKRNQLKAEDVRRFRHVT